MHLKVLFVIVLGTIWAYYSSPDSRVSAQADQIYYKIPNPFWDDKDKSTGYFAIKSFQCVISSHNKKTQTEVEEYFSLDYGISYSLHRNRDDRSQSYAIIGAGNLGQSYIVRNPSANPTEELDCELDHMHNQRQVFPWQYIYQVSSLANNNDTAAAATNTTNNTDSTNGGSQNKKRRRNNSNKKKRWQGKRFIYGVGAVWMNAIEREVVSDEVGDDSPFPGSNQWLMRENDLEIKLLFDKPEEWPSDRAGQQRSVAASKLSSIQIRRQNMLEPDQEMGGTNSIDESIDLITIQSFQRELSTNDPALKRVFSQLAECRRKTRKHRVFPSLTRAVSIAPERLYAIEYVERKDSSMMVEEGKFDQRHHRILRNSELHTEWFSFKHEAQVDVYEPTNMYKNKNDFTIDDHMVDVFLKRFSEREAQRSSRHSTVHYHYVELNGQVDNCKVGEKDPPPKWFSLMTRQINLRRSNGNSLTGYITGVGALLMNAADIHYKQFNLFKRTINALYDPFNLLSRREVIVDEWQLFHKASERTVHFYFAERKDGSQHEIGDLIRIDVRDSKVKDRSDRVVEDFGVDTTDDFDMLVRYEILNLELDKDAASAEFMLTPPEQCLTNNSTNDDQSNANDKDSGSDSDEDDFRQEEEKYSSDEETEQDPDESHEQQDEGEDFEFEPGKLMESFQFPDFYDFFQGQVSYNIVYTIELSDSEANNQTSKRIHLMELVDTEANLARHMVFNSKRSFDEMEPELEYYIDYNSELMCRNQGETCSIVDNLEPWFFLFSAKLNYYRKLTKDSTVSMQSDRLRTYGLGALWRLASQSEYSYFMGMRKATLIKADKCEYREVSWGLEDDNDSDFLIEFKFLWNATQHNLDSVVGKNRGPNELLSLNTIYFTPNPVSSDKGNFKELRISEPIAINSLAANSLSLPKMYADLEEIRAKEDDDTDAHRINHADKVPSFWDYIKPTNSYVATYYVSHAPQQEDMVNQMAQSIHINRIFEHIDRFTNTGRIVLGYGPEVIEVYLIDGGKTLYSFMPAKGLCKRIASLSGLIDIVTGFQEKEIDFNSGKMVGLAALWIHISQLQNSFLYESELAYNGQGHKVEIRTYKLTSDGFESGGPAITYDIVASFSAPPNPLRSPRDAPTPGEFSLDSVDFIPRYTKSHSGKSPFHRTTIHVESITTDSFSSVDLHIPDECAHISPNKDTDVSNGGGSSDPQLNFPRLSSIIQLTEQFYMRSEMTSYSSEWPGVKKLYIMDAWYHFGDIRLRTYGLQRDFDLLIYSRTKEAFDLSTPYKCPSALPKLLLSAQRSDTSLLDFWSETKNYVDNLAQLFYDPLALWRQAELNIGSVKLVSSLELAPLPDSSSSSSLELLEREMRTEVWRVTSPNASNVWSYDMYFELVTDKESKRQWHVLESIEIYDGLQKDAIVGGGQKIEVEVVNYRYNHTDRELLSKFIIPEGYSCVRNPSVQDELRRTGDDLNVSWELEHLMWYEASLAIVTNGNQALESWEGPENIILPTATGLLVRSARFDAETPIDLYVHYMKSHYINGTTTSTKTVYDRSSSLIYMLDRRTGFCGIGQDQGRTIEWTIEFPTHGEHMEYITMDSKMMELLFRPTKDYYRPINRYTIDGMVYSVYEHSLDSLPSKQTSLQGPVTIIRNFQHPIGAKMLYRLDGNSSIKMHQGISVKMLVFDELRARVKAILNISLKGVMNIGLTELMRYVNVAQCYNDGDETSDRQVRSFAIEYQSSESAVRGTRTRITSTTRDFIIRLFKSAFLLPTQFYGSPRIEFLSHKRFMFTFSLIEAPTAIEYASRRMVESRMSLNLESKSEIKLVSSLAECSKWCDLEGCIALNYCSDRTCRILTPNMLHKGRGSSSEILTPKDLSDLFTSTHDPDCAYFVWVSSRPSTLDKFSTIMDVNINQNQNEKIRPSFMILKLFGTFFEPANPLKFYEIKDNLESLAEDSELDSERQAPVFKTAWYDRSLDHTKLEQLIDSQSGENQRYKLSMTVAHNYADCQTACQRDTNCMMISYCKQTAACELISAKGLDMKALEPALEPTLESAGCRVVVRDFLAQYTQFKDTLEPTSFQLKLTNYSDLECAALCNQQEQFKCLSFDLCQEDEGVGQSACYLQSVHVMLDSFDRSILAPRWHDENLAKQMSTCDHYSKSMLADYRQISNRQLFQDEEKELVRGHSPDRCAINCHEDDECCAFEYCFDDTRQPVQSCYFIRFKEPVGLDEKTLVEQLTLNYSDKCSIYIMDHQVEEYKIDEGSRTVILDVARKIITNDRTQSFFLTMCGIAGALLVGLIIQIVYIRLVGLPILMKWKRL